MIDVIGTAITDEIVRRLKEAELQFAVIADETPDTSHNEQFSITVRYVYQGDVEEKLLALRIVDQTTSEMLFETLCAVLKSHDIDVTHLRGQCYDGASNVSGIRTGLQARIKEISPSALFVHCYAHVLNLVIVDAMTSNTTARDFFGTRPSKLVRIYSNMHETTCCLHPAASRDPRKQWFYEEFPSSYTEELVRNALGLPSKCDQHIQCDRRGNCRNVENHPRN